MADELPWTFQSNMTPDLRQARALEYIAHYLDRIARAMESGAGNEPLRRDLKELGEALRQG
jgi:hypothetical protein